MTMNSVRADLAYTREKQEAASAHAVRAILGALQPLSNYGPRYIKEKIMPCETRERADKCDGTGCNKRDSRA